MIDRGEYLRMRGWSRTIEGWSDGQVDHPLHEGHAEQIQLDRDEWVLYVADRRVPANLRFVKEQRLTGHWIADSAGSGIFRDDAGSTSFFHAFFPPEALPSRAINGRLMAKSGPTGRWRIVVEFEPIEPAGVGT